MPFIHHMDRNNVRWAGGAGAVGRPERNAEVAAALGDRYILATGQGQWISLKVQNGVSALENAARSPTLPVPKV